LSFKLVQNKQKQKNNNKIQINGVNIWPNFFWNL
jgi:hypothetical protein